MIDQEKWHNIAVMVRVRTFTKNKDIDKYVAKMEQELRLQFGDNIVSVSHHSILPDP